MIFDSCVLLKSGSELLFYIIWSEEEWSKKFRGSKDQHITCNMMNNFKKKLFVYLPYILLNLITEMIGIDILGCRRLINMF